MNEKLQQITSMTDFNPARMAHDTTTIWTIYLPTPLPCLALLSTHAIGEWALELQTWNLLSVGGNLPFGHSDWLLGHLVAGPLIIRNVHAEHSPDMVYTI